MPAIFLRQDKVLLRMFTSCPFQGKCHQNSLLVLGWDHVNITPCLFSTTLLLLLPYFVCITELSLNFIAYHWTFHQTLFSEFTGVKFSKVQWSSVKFYESLVMIQWRFSDVFSDKFSEGTQQKNLLRALINYITLRLLTVHRFYCNAIWAVLYQII